MPTAAHTVRIYAELADCYERQGQAKLRDWFLVLAADAALAAGRLEEAEHYRGRLLEINPHHLLRPFASLEEGLKSPDVQGYIADLRRAYPPDTAEQLLQLQRDAAPPEAQALGTFRSVSAPAARGPVPERPRDEPEPLAFRMQSDLEATVPPEPRPQARKVPEPAPPALAPRSAAAPPRPAPAPAKPKPVKARQPAPVSAARPDEDDAA